MKQRSDGRWVRVRKINGRSVSFYSKAKTEKAAVRDIENQMIQYAEKQQQGAAFKNVAAEWEAEHREKVQYKTWSGYESHYKRAVEHFGDRHIDSISIAEIQSYIMQFAKQGYAYKTVRTLLQVISLIYDYAIINGYYKQANPCTIVKIPRGLSKKKRELPSDQMIGRIKKSADCHFGLFAYLLLYTGLRRGEALALTDKDIDFSNKVIHVTKSVYFKSNRPCLKSTKTESGIRDVYLLDCLAEKLKGKKGYIFGGDEPMSEQAYRRAWEHYKRDSGVTEITPHQLRHAYATILFDAGIDDKTAQSLLGHSDYKITKEIYTHISEKRKKESFDKLLDLSKISQQLEKLE